ncbi:PILR alpha-associated neural protein [Amia ocellicauda]|uniref:PILR alpha-associated neural protein n=1 Tax=Amia ocellicauda TaxID=2972642 RepID=UPI00346469C3
MERCSISLPHSTPLLQLSALCLLVAIATPPGSCDRAWGSEVKGEGGGEEGESAGPLLSVTAPVTPTAPWAVLWGPTHPLEDETGHFLSAQETHHRIGTQGEEEEEEEEEKGGARTPRHHHRVPGGPATTDPQLQLEERDRAREREREDETEGEEKEVDPQFYVTVTISSVLILTAAIITAKLCYDRSCSQHTPPLSRGAAPSLSLSLPRSLSPEDSRQTLTGGGAIPRTPSFDRDRIPVVNL